MPYPDDWFAPPYMRDDDALELRARVEAQAARLDALARYLGALADYRPGDETDLLADQLEELADAVEEALAPYATRALPVLRRLRRKNQMHGAKEPPVRLWGTDL